MTITEQNKELKAKLEAQASDMAKVQACADEYKVAIEAKAAEAVAMIAAKDGKIAELGAQVEAANVAMAEAVKQVEACKGEIDKLNAKLKLAPYADVSEGQSPVADGGAAQSVPKLTHAQKIEELGTTTPAAITYYRQHEQEIKAEQAGK